MPSPRASVVLALALAVAALAACSGSSDEATSSGGAAGSGSAGKGGSASGASGKAGASTSGAAGQTAAGKSGAAGGGGSAVQAGTAGAATGGKAGAGQAGAAAGQAGAGGQTVQSLLVVPNPATATVKLGQAALPIAFKAMAVTSGGTNDVTTTTTWDAKTPALGTFSAATKGQLDLTGQGGLGSIVASYAGLSTTVSLTVKVTGTAGVGVDPAMAEATFAAAKPDASSPVPALEYPLAGVLLPSNLPAITVQHTGDADSTLYRVRLVSATADLTVYSSAKEVLLPTAVWEAWKTATADQPSTIAVDGVGPKGIHAGATQAIGASSDPIPTSAVYYWQNSTATFRVLDIVKGTETALPTNVPLGQNGCVGCHRISRDGKRFSYTEIGTYFRIGTLGYDVASMSFPGKITPTDAKRGSYATFNPNEPTQIPAMLLTVPDFVPQNTAGDVTLSMVDPDVGTAIPSTMAGCLGKLPLTVGRHALMPDWAPDGSFVTFVAYPGQTHFVRDLGDDVVLGSIVEAPVSYDAGTKSFTFGDPVVHVATPSTEPDAGENNFLPTVSPDGKLIAFTRANGWWGVKTQNTSLTPLNTTGRIAVVRRSDHKVFELAGGTNGPAGHWSSTWPQWAPAVGKKVVWLAFATERPYGHLLTPANQTCSLIQGQAQCKQLWIMAVDLAKLSDPAGAIDPSSPPFWVPGQSIAAQSVSPQWVVPAGKQ